MGFFKGDFVSQHQDNNTAPGSINVSQENSRPTAYANNIPITFHHAVPTNQGHACTN